MPTGEVVLARAESADTVTGGVEVTALEEVERRAERAGPDVSVAIVCLADGDRALALRAAATHVEQPAGARAWDHTSLAVRDLDEAVGFYRDALAFEVAFTERGMREQIQRITGIDGISCDLAQLRSPLSPHTLELIAFHDVPSARAAHAPTTPGAGHVAFAVDDLQRALAAITARGGRMLGEVTEFESGPGLYCQDPSGTFLELDQG